MKKSKKKGFKLPKYSAAGLYTDPNVTGANAYGAKQTNPYLQSAEVSEEGGSGMSTGQYTQAGMAIANGGMQSFNAYDNPNLNSYQKSRAMGAGLDNAKTGVATAMNPALGMAVGAATKIGSKAQDGLSKTDSQGNLVDKGGSKAGEVVGGLMSPSNSLMAIYSDPNATTSQKVAGALTGGLSDMFTNRHKNQVESSAKADIKAQQEQEQLMQQQNQIYKNGGAFNLMHPFNNPNFNIPMFPMGGNTQFGGNAQLEKQENTLNPDGSTTQFNLPTHENQDSDEGTKLDPGTLIFSDRLKPKGSKTTFAILNKPNNTDKEDRVLDNTSSTGLAKRTAQLMKDAKHKQSLKLFQEQELLKQSKANNYIKRLGGVMQFPEGGKVDAMGFPIDATGRRLTSAEQLGYSRPGYTYGNNTMQGVSGANTNPLTGQMNPGILNAGPNPNMGKTLEPFSYTAGQTTPDGRPVSYNDAFNNYLATQTDAYGKPLKQKLGGMMPKYKDGARLQEMISPEPELMPYDYNKSYNSPWDNPEWIAANANQNSSKTDQSTGPNFKGMLGQAGMWAANNAGELAYLIDQGKKYDTQQEYKYNPTLLDPTASLRDADNIARTAAYDLADKASGHAGNYLTNRTALATSMLLNKDKIRREYANANAGISNEGQLTNIKGKYMVDDINAKNKGAALNQYYKSIERMGTNTAQAGKDNKATQMDQKTLDMMGSMFSNYKYDPTTNSWIFKK